MTPHVSKSLFKAKALEFFRQVETSGESLVITDNGIPKLEVRPYQPNDFNPLALLKNSLLKYDAPTDPIGEENWESLR